MVLAAIVGITIALAAASAAAATTAFTTNSLCPLILSFGMFRGLLDEPREGHIRVGTWSSNSEHCCRPTVVARAGSVDIFFLFNVP